LKRIKGYGVENELTQKEITILALERLLSST